MPSTRAAEAAPARRRPRVASLPDPKPAAPLERPERSRTRARPRRPASRSGHRLHLRPRATAVWIAVGTVLLSGIVFVNLANLRLNMRVEQATQERAQLRAVNAELESKLSSALAAARIQQLAAHREGLVQADPSSIGYINLGGS